MRPADAHDLIANERLFATVVQSLRPDRSVGRSPYRHREERAVRELRAGLWHWQAPHPDWTPSERWPQEVSSYAIDDGARALLFDPLAVPDELLELAVNREPVVVLTAPWHERDTQSSVPLVTDLTS
jgi:hypothetical protein